MGIVRGRLEKKAQSSAKTKIIIIHHHHPHYHSQACDLFILRWTMALTSTHFPQAIPWYFDRIGPPPTWGTLLALFGSSKPSHNMSEVGSSDATASPGPATAPAPINDATKRTVQKIPLLKTR